MVSLHQVRRQCQALSLKAIDEIAEVLLEEGGMSEVLKGLAILINGEILQPPVIARLEKQAAKIRSA